MDEPEIPSDAEVDAQVRALLAALPQPGPMPDDVVARISAELDDEAILRVDRGPLSHAERDSAVLAPLIRQRQRPRPLFAVAAVAAAAAVVAVGGSALHLKTRPQGAAVLGTATTLLTPSNASIRTTPDAISRLANPNLHLQLSRTSYTADNLASNARVALTRPDAPPQVLEAEAPRLGPLATEAGLTSCLDALGLPTDVPVRVDLADYEDLPAAVIVVTTAAGSTVRVVARSCTTGHPAVVVGSTPVG